MNNPSEGTGSTIAISFDRRVSPALMRVLGSGGPFASLVARCLEGNGRFDLQLRREPKGRRSWATFYVGLTSVLDLDERDQTFRLRAHQTHQKAGGFDEAWSDWQLKDSLAAQWTAVERYLDRVIPSVDPHWTASEGAVQGAICFGHSATYRVVQREASPSFRNTEVREAISKSISEPLYAAVAAAIANQASPPPWWPGIRDRGKRKPLGTALDVLAIDLDGRLLAIEAKSADAIAGVVWGPAQVRFYAELLNRWLDEPATDSTVIGAMLEQRVALGLAPSITPLVEPIAIVPMLVIGAGTVSPFAKKRVNKLADAIDSVAAGHRLQPLEIWRVDAFGGLTERWR